MKRHFYQHLNVPVRPLKCRCDSCKWFGAGAKDYPQHKISHKHQSNIEAIHHVGRDEAIPNSRKYEVEDDVWEEVEVPEKSGEEDQEVDSEVTQIKADKFWKK